MASKRDIGVVIGDVMGTIPDDFERAAELKQRLGWIRDAAGYTAPEVMTRRWMELLAVLNDMVGPIVPGTWTEDVACIVDPERKKTEAA